MNHSKKTKKEHLIGRTILHLIPIFIIASFMIFILHSQDICGELSMASTGTEFYMMTANTPLIKPLFNNTNIFVYVNEDSIPDYTLKLNDTKLITLSPPWKTRIGSRIVSDKPIIVKYLAYRKDYTGKMTVEKAYCTVPDINSYKNKYLANTGVHNLISEKDAEITILGKKKIDGRINEQKIVLKKNIPSTITLSEQSALISEEKFISSNAYCKDYLFSNDFYTMEGLVEITPFVEFTKNNTQLIKIDYNNDEKIDQIINISRTLRLKNIAPGTRFFSDMPFSVTQLTNISGIIVVEISFEGFVVKSKEHISDVIDNEIKENSVKIVAIWDILANNIFNKKITKLEWIINQTAVGFELIQKSQSNVFLILSELIVPQISTYSHIDANGNDVIRIFNPHKTLEYNNFSSVIICKNNSQQGCIKKITRKNLHNDEILDTIQFDKIEDKHILNNSVLQPENYIEILGNEIKSYSIRCSDVKK